MYRWDMLRYESISPNCSLIRVSTGKLLIPTMSAVRGRREYSHYVGASPVSTHRAGDISFESGFVFIRGPLLGFATSQWGPRALSAGAGGAELSDHLSVTWRRRRRIMADAIVTPSTRATAAWTTILAETPSLVVDTAGRPAGLLVLALFAVGAIVRDRCGRPSSELPV